MGGPSPTSQSLAAVIARNRFGLGARADDKPLSNPKGWLLGQFEDYAAVPKEFKDLPSSATLYGELQRERAKLRPLSPNDRKAAATAIQKRGGELYRHEVGQRAAVALTSRTPFVERLVYFWANHFCVSADKLELNLLAGAFEREAIRPHVLGRFEDMLLAVEKHPAMLFYLDQARSIGPDSQRAQQAAKHNPKRRLGINENLAREIMELHTLGVRSGYSQQDVTRFALTLTGWTVSGLSANGKPPKDGQQAGHFVFEPVLHERRPLSILGRRYDQPGVHQGEAVLHDLAASEATAGHIAGKLARHLVADDPPPALHKRLTEVFLRTDGDLPSLYRALLDTPESWQPKRQKFKTPWEWSLSALRALGRGPGTAKYMPQLASQLQQPVWRPKSPAGYEDTAAAWAAPDALIRRVEMAQRLAQHSDAALDARKLAKIVLGPTLSPASETQIAQAESPKAALALLLVSPEFQRR